MKLTWGLIARRVLLIFPLVLASSCTAPGADTGHYFELEDVGLRLPRLPRWQPVEAGNGLLRIVRHQSVPGAPRVDVLLEPTAEKPEVLESFLTKSLRTMAAMEEQGLLRLTTIDQQQTRVGPRRAYRVRHEYMMGKDNVAFTQISVLFVLDGRGVAITAAGRTELFLPVATEINEILAGIATPIPTAVPNGEASSTKTTEIDPLPIEAESHSTAQ